MAARGPGGQSVDMPPRSANAYWITVALATSGVFACGETTLETSAAALTASATVKHVVVIVQENHSFDSYFGTWCQAPAYSNPTCTNGAACCEAAPVTDAAGASPVLLTDALNGSYSPNHASTCEQSEINGGRMDQYTTAACGDPRNFALAEGAVGIYRRRAADFAIVDRYFQPIVGASSSNDMYFATARAKFVDNQFEPLAVGHGCSTNRQTVQYSDVTLMDLLAAHGVRSTWYAEGYQAMAEAWTCPDVPADCTSDLYFPCIYDPGDIPAAYFGSTADNPAHIKDYGQYKRDLFAGTIPEASFIKALNHHSEHPDWGTSIRDGVAIVVDTVAAIELSRYRHDTLVLLTWDESGGYYDHVPPPAAIQMDGQSYGPRVPLLALGPLARRGTVSHVELEHSSIVKFIEWNWLGKTGLLHARDAVVNNLGSLLDPALGVPEK